MVIGRTAWKPYFLNIGWGCLEKLYRFPSLEILETSRARLSAVSAPEAVGPLSGKLGISRWSPCLARGAHRIVREDGDSRLSGKENSNPHFSSTSSLRKKRAAMAELDDTHQPTTLGAWLVSFLDSLQRLFLSSAGAFCHLVCEPLGWWF